MQILKHILLLVLINKIRFLNGDQLLNDFLQVKTLRYAHIINCDDDYNNVKLYNSLKHVGASVIIHSLETCCRIKYIHHKTAFFLDADCFGWKQLIQEMAQNGFFNSTCHWLIKSSNYIDIESELSQLPLNIDSEVTIAIRSSEIVYNLYEVYNSGFNHYGTFNMTKFGYWKKETGILSLANQYKYLRRANMTGVVLKCMIVVTRKLKNEMFEDYVQTVELTHIDSMNRFNFALLLHLRDIYNFSFNMMRTKSWGYLHNGTFDGMVGSLQKKEADIGGAPIFFRSDRAKVIDYTTETWTSRPCFIFRHPKELGSFYNIYTRPLDDYVWYSTLGLIALIAIALRYLLKENKKNYPKEDIDTSWSYTGLAVLSAICQQGLTIGHSSTTIRLTLYMAFIFALTMYQFYSASIVSSLLMEAPRNIRTLEDLLNSPLKAGIEDILYNIDYFSRTTDPVALELYRAKIKTTKGKNYFSASDGLAMVKKGGFAFHVDIATAYKIIRETFTEREICELVEVQLFPPQRMVAIVQKGSPFRKMVTYGLRKIAETGLMHRQRLLWHESKPKCIKTPDSTIFAVSIYEFSMALMVLFCGMMLSLVILMMEIIMHRRTTKGSILDNCFDKVKKVKSIDVRRKLRKPF